MVASLFPSECRSPCWCCKAGEINGFQVIHGDYRSKSLDLKTVIWKRRFGKKILLEVDAGLGFSAFDRSVERRQGNTPGLPAEPTRKIMIRLKHLVCLLFVQTGFRLRWSPRQSFPVV